MKFPKPVRPPKARKPIRRGKPLARSRMRRQPTKPRQGANPGYVAWLHSQPCVGEAYWPGGHTCADTREESWNPIEQSHARDMTGTGRKEPDLRSVPKCRSLHQQWEQHRGRFAGWTKERRRVWMAAGIEATNQRWFALTPAQRADWDAKAAAQRSAA